jgi:peptide deformylase
VARLAILEYPDVRLRRRAAPVHSIDAGVGQLVDDLLETMYATRGIGLAATQVDVHRQVVVMDVSPARDSPQVFINPQVIAGEAEGIVEESCLSVPGIVARIRRATKLRVSYIDRTGGRCERTLEMLAAVCLQHEIDHLHGKVLLDRVPWFTRLRLKARRSAVLRAQHS